MPKERKIYLTIIAITILLLCGCSITVRISQPTCGINHCVNRKGHLGEHLARSVTEAPPIVNRPSGVPYDPTPSLPVQIPNRINNTKKGQ